MNFSRRALLVGTGAAVVGTACGDDTPNSANPASQYVLGTLFPKNGLLRDDAPTRLPFQIAPRGDAPLATYSGSVGFRVLNGSGKVVQTGEATARSRGLAQPFVPFVVEAHPAGIYDLEATYEGVTMTASVNVSKGSDLKFPAIGAKLEPIATPTASNTQGVNPICTADPPCELHAESWDQLATMGVPVAILLATPKFCQTMACGPELELFRSALKKYPAIHGIHAEVYANAEAVKTIAEATLSPFAEHSQLPFEPCLFLIGPDGTLKNRLDLLFDGDEIEMACAELV